MPVSPASSIGMSSSSATMRAPGPTPTRSGWTRDRPVIALNTWAVGRWPLKQKEEDYVELVARLGRREDVQVLLLGGSGERDATSDSRPFRMCGSSIRDARTRLDTSPR